MATKSLVDGFIAITRGMNENIHPLLLANTQVPRAVNINFDNNLARTRRIFF